MSERPPVLLAEPTPDSVRGLASAGISVTAAATPAGSPVRWSRYVARRVPLAVATKGPEFIASLRAFGRSEPGHVLLGSTDSGTWLIARHREELSKLFRLRPPPAEAVYTVLNKVLLNAAARAAGLEVPKTWTPASASEVSALASQIPFPAVVKPRTSIGIRDWTKGRIAHSAAELAPTYARLAAGGTHARWIAEHDPDIDWPIIQEYHPIAPDHIYHLVGFVDETGDLSTVFAHRKILQYPRRLGVGLCFEPATADPGLRERLLGLCRQVGYHGIFEVEFIPHEGSYLLIDFNPRFYNGMALDMARGLPLPYLAYLHAIDDRESLAAAIAATNGSASDSDLVQCQRFLFEVMLRAQRLTGNFSREDVRRWRQWKRAHAGRIVDPSADPADPWPARLQVISHLWSFARRPRYFLGTFALNR